MFKKPKTPMSAVQVQPTWQELIKLERRLKRNKLLCRILQPVGSVIFLFNLLLCTANFALYIGGTLIEEYFTKMPLLPAMVESFPRGSFGGVIAFTLCFSYLIPLAISGAITAVIYFLDRKKYGNQVEPLRGSEAECAKALVYEAETVYELRKQIPQWSIFAETSILTALTAIPILYTCIAFAKGESPAVLEIAIGCLALLVCLFVLFWVYAALFKVFSLSNALFYFSPSEWSLYEQYHRLDAYWESVDPLEFAKREEKARRLQEEKARKRRKKSSDDLPEDEEP